MSRGDVRNPLNENGRRGPFTWPLVVALAAVGLLGEMPAYAMIGGITGYSGKQLFTCSQCHNDGIAPVVHFEGPTEVAAGDTATFGFVVQSRSEAQRVAGFNVAASAGILGLAPVEDDASLKSGELTHVAPKEVDENLLAAWAFTWQAPVTPGTVTLYGAGLSANGDGTNSGDQPDSTALTVLVTPGPAPGDGNCDGRLSAADLIGIAKIIGGASAGTCDLADANCDQTVNDKDLTTVVASLFAPTVPAPCAD